MSCCTSIGPCESIDTVWISNRNRSKNIGVENCEERGVKSERKCDSSEDCQHDDRRAAEAPHCVPHVRERVLDQAGAACVATLLFAFFDSAHFQERLTTRFFWGQTFADVLFGFSLDVVAQLVFKLLVYLSSTKQRPQPQRNRIQPMLRSHLIVSYSYLRATIGSTLAARRTGK